MAVNYFFLGGAGRGQCIMAKNKVLACLCAFVLAIVWAIVSSGHVGWLWVWLPFVVACVVAFRCRAFCAWLWSLGIGEGEK